jgi:hypothetical protein
MTSLTSRLLLDEEDIFRAISATSIADLVLAKIDLSILFLIYFRDGSLKILDP